MKYIIEVETDKVCKTSAALIKALNHKDTRYTIIRIK